MFTGLVEETGRLARIDHRDDGGARLTIQASGISGAVALGDSVSVNGCCLTVTHHDATEMAFDLLGETLRRTNLGGLPVGGIVNLERSLKADGRLGGHFVQGHIDTTIAVKSATRHGHDLCLELEMPAEFAPYIAFKGSVALNGTSLTVADLGSDTFRVWIIPHTASATNIGTLAAADIVNLECDILAKYAARILQAGRYSTENL
jgi:riboflavin synthase